MYLNRDSQHRWDGSAQTVSNPIVEFDDRLLYTCIPCLHGTCSIDLSSFRQLRRLTWQVANLLDLDALFVANPDQLSMFADTGM